MSRLLALAVAVTLLGVTACDDTQDHAPQTSAAQSSPRQAEAAAKVTAPAASVSQTAILTQDQALELAARGNCLLCHKIEYKLVGPAWKDVAAKYKSTPNAANIIALHITTGGSFGWNLGTMPARGGSTIPDTEIASLARFIATLK